MPHPVKKVYAEDSPGGRRAKTGITLTQIKKNLRATPRMVSRKFYRDLGELA